MRLAASLLFLIIGLGAASAETLVTSLSSHRVLITSNYTGTAIALFGAIERDAQTISRGSNYDAVVTVRGPAQYLVVREKERLGPLWLNREQQKFPMAPAFISVLSNQPIAAITSDQLRQRQKLGLQAIIAGADFTNDREGADEPFREALLRLKRKDGLYVEDDRAVAFLTPTIFKANITLAPTAPPGNYDVEVTLLADTVILARALTHFELVKTGFEQQVGEAAHDWSWLYGLSTAALALFFGWLANVIFRRD